MGRLCFKRANQTGELGNAVRVHKWQRLKLIHDAWAEASRDSQQGRGRAAATKELAWLEGGPTRGLISYLNTSKKSSPRLNGKGQTLIHSGAKESAAASSSPRAQPSSSDSKRKGEAPGLPRLAYSFTTDDLIRPRTDSVASRKASVCSATDDVVREADIDLAVHPPSPPPSPTPSPHGARGPPDAPSEPDGSSIGRRAAAPSAVSVHFGGPDSESASFKSNKRASRSSRSQKQRGSLASASASIIAPSASSQKWLSGPPSPALAILHSSELGGSPGCPPVGAPVAAPMLIGDDARPASLPQKKRPSLLGSPRLCRGGGFSATSKRRTSVECSPSVPRRRRSSVEVASPPRRYSVDGGNGVTSVLLRATQLTVATAVWRRNADGGPALPSPSVAADDLEIAAYDAEQSPAAAPSTALASSPGGAMPHPKKPGPPRRGEPRLGICISAAEVSGKVSSKAAVGWEPRERADELLWFVPALHVGAPLRSWHLLRVHISTHALPPTMGLPTGDDPIFHRAVRPPLGTRLRVTSAEGGSARAGGEWALLAPFGARVRGAHIAAWTVNAVLLLGGLLLLFDRLFVASTKWDSSTGRAFGLTLVFSFLVQDAIKVCLLTLISAYLLPGRWAPRAAGVRMVLKGVSKATQAVFS